MMGNLLRGPGVPMMSWDWQVGLDRIGQLAEAPRGFRISEVPVRCSSSSGPATGHAQPPQDEW